MEEKPPVAILTAGGVAESARPRDNVIDRFWHSLSETQFALLMIAPSMVLLLLVSTAPLLSLIGLSLFRIDFGNPTSNGFAGLSNYVHMVRDPGFWHAIELTAIYTTAAVVFQLVIGMALALLFFRPFGGILRVFVILPMILAPVVVGLVFRTLILTPRYGILDYISSSIGLGSHEWLAQPTLALISVISIHAWQWTPFAFLVFLANLNALPVDILEAALLDCQTSWQNARYVIFPLIRPAIIIVTVMRAIIALGAFAAPYAATGGGPGNATMILNLYAYSTAFVDLNIGYGSALATMLLLITIAVSWLFFRLRPV